MDNIKRIAEKELKALLAYNPVVAILGSRQSGKTTLAKMLSNDIDKFLYIDAEKPSNRAMLEDAEFFFESNRNKFICIDEIQRMPEIFQIFRSEVDEKRIPGRFLILGSASKDLIKQSSETLAGRISYYELTPFLYVEICDQSILNDYWLKGGYPLSFLAPDDKTSLSWRQNFILTFLERDMPQLGINIPAETMRRLWTILAHLHGQLLNVSNLGNSLGFTNKTVKSYIDILSETFMVRQLKPYETNVSKRIVKTPKVYIRDHGILNTLLNIPSFNDLLAHPVFGASWEGLVIENLTGIAPNWEPFFYRTSNGAELDLILTFGKKVIAVECKATKSPKLTRGFWNAVDDVQPMETWVVAPIKDAYPLKENVWVMSLTDAIHKMMSIQDSLFE
ncbi:MAG: ATP-binding protein [Prolixibacteraceae bacterium]|nr:ATP-binding protein [Prolixibacteraceae bacterium]